LFRKFPPFICEFLDAISRDRPAVRRPAQVERTRMVDDDTDAADDAARYARDLRDAHAGDVAARDALATDPANLDLVEAIARMIHRGRRLGVGVDLDDLVGYGRVGLMHAATKFDRGRGVRFNTYATPWIKREIRRGLVADSSPIHIPEWARREALRVDPAVRAAPGPRFAGGAKGEYILAAIHVIHAEHVRAPDNVLERHPDLWTNAAGPADGPGPKEWGAALREIERLPVRLRSVVARHHGLGGGRALDLAEIAREDGVTRQATRQAYTKAIRLLQATLDPSSEVTATPSVMAARALHEAAAGEDPCGIHHGGRAIPSFQESRSCL
jgi:hypothetical protein